MAMVAFWCVQYRPELRPCMSVVVKMLEGAAEIPAPLYSFGQMVVGSPCPVFFNFQHWTDSSSYGTRSSGLAATTPLMRRFGIEMASS